MRKFNEQNERIKRQYLSWTPASTPFFFREVG
jgi:hypothetical protein